MKLKQDCIRDTLLFLEKNMSRTGFFSSHSIQLDNFSTEDIDYTVEKLSEAGYLTLASIYCDGHILIRCITYDGHQFLDNIRDDKVWAKTKLVLSKFSSTSMSFVQEVASQVISNIISNSLYKK